ncbi:CU044_2847 family protein [Streptomyces sp. NPDC055013]
MSGELGLLSREFGPRCCGVHLLGISDPPSELSVTFGVQVGQHLKLGIVGGNGQAHLTVTASWKPSPGAE